MSRVDLAYFIHGKTLAHSRAQFRFLLVARWSLPLQEMRTLVTPAFDGRIRVKDNRELH